MQVNFDAIVVGSGPGGGITANYLAKAGFSVLVLEAGMNVPHDITKETSEAFLTRQAKSKEAIKALGENGQKIADYFSEICMTAKIEVLLYDQWYF